MGKYEVELLEDQVRFDPDGTLVHHPLNSTYTIDSQRGYSHGHFTFAGHDLAGSRLLTDVHVFYLMLHTNGDDESGREAWADPLRLAILHRLAVDGNSWYLSLTGVMQTGEGSSERVTIESDIQRSLLDPGIAVGTVVDSEWPAHYGRGFNKRLFVEVTPELLRPLFDKYWPDAGYGYPIEGITMKPGQISMLASWNERPRNDILLSEVLDAALTAFFTFPEDPQHFVFLSRQLDYPLFRKMLDIDDLQRMADRIANDSRVDAN